MTKRLKITNPHTNIRGKWDFIGYNMFQCTNCEKIFTLSELISLCPEANYDTYVYLCFCPNCDSDNREDISGE